MERSEVWSYWRNYSVPPGTCVAILGGAAAIYTILPADYMSARERVSFIVGITLLMVIEIAVLHRERQRQQKEIVAVQTDAHSRFIVTQAKLAIIEQLHRMGLNASFKRDALEFIQSLINFFTDQLLGGPERQISFGTLLAASGGDQEVWERYRQRKLAEAKAIEHYKSDLAPKVIVLRDQLKARGLADEELNVRLDRPPSMVEISIVIAKLEELVTRLD